MNYRDQVVQTSSSAPLIPDVSSSFKNFSIATREIVVLGILVASEYLSSAFERDSSSLTGNWR